MDTSKKQTTIWVIVALVATMLYFGNKPSASERRTNSISEGAANTNDGEPPGNTFAGYDCTEDCSGHEAGYAWAEEHNITDGDDCDAAGEHSNSPSFAEGCHAYVDGDADPREEGKNSDSDDDN